MAATTLAASAVSAHGQGKNPPRKAPNVLYVFSDQHRAVSLPGEPYDQATAPNIDAFRKANLSMDRCVSNYPLCTPYRSILMTGRWPFQTGMWHNGATINPSEVSLGDTFGKAGYHTGYIGKWHLGGGAGGEQGFIPKGPKRLGFEDWHVWDLTNNHYHAWTYNQDTGEKIFPEGWQPIRMTDQAIDFLKARTPDKPWFLMLSWNPPHPPFNPPPIDQDLYPPATLTFRPNVKTAPPGAPIAGPAHFLASNELIQKAMQGYYGGITGVDKEFGRLMQALKASGMADNTIVIYTSDHGEMMGSHGRMAKQVPFEESCRVPFAVRYPGVTPKGAKNDALFAAIDIYPTVCGLAGVPVPPTCQGRDHSPMMMGKTMPRAEVVFLLNEVPKDEKGDDEGVSEGVAAARQAGGAGGGGGRGGRGQGGRAQAEGGGGGEARKFINQPSYRGLRSDTHTYAVAETGRWLLYDNIADPYQMNNLVRDPGQQALMAKYDAMIEGWLKASKDPFPYGGALNHFSDFPF